MNKDIVFPYDPATLGQNYEPDLVTWEDMGKQAQVETTPAATDTLRTALIIVDPERDFVFTNGALSVPGAVDDIDRIIKYIQRDWRNITTVFVSRDKHPVDGIAIFFPKWWIDQNGKNPDPFTMITYDDIVSGKWRPVYDPIWSVKYVKALEDAGKNLVIWTFHCQENTDGQKLVPQLHEIIAFHAAARQTSPVFIDKGTSRRTEHFGIFKAEVPDSRDPSTGLNTAVLDVIAGYDLIYVAGEAKSHCVLETMKQMVAYFGSQPDVIKKIRFLMDCTSSVVSPFVDFETIAMAELKKMEALGVQLVKSTDL